MKFVVLDGLHVPLGRVTAASALEARCLALQWFPEETTLYVVRWERASKRQRQAAKAGALLDCPPRVWSSMGRDWWRP